ncbi:MAG: hypothetical protein A2505_03360 [Deltaproteobacteria bacterium RIFOXYD12_FULL_55_16]|nr:MAG: hypothetical protein A2505_03360 [Deltaproteobacteria bacterium RIFOXYD12_FULL_55_16]
MKKTMVHWLLIGLFILSGPKLLFADDTCVFAVTANDVPPNVVFLLDNGAEMEQIIWHSSYNKDTSYTPALPTVSAFSNSSGYAVEKQGNTYYLQPIQANLTLTSTGQIAGVGNNPTWLINGRQITLPFAPSTAVDASGIKDNATRFRYTSNYLNWLFYSAGWTAAGEPGKDVAAPFGTADVVALPSKTRFYYAKQAIFSVARNTANRAQFGIYNFTANSNGASNVQPLGMVVTTPLVSPSSSNVLQSNFVNNINNMGTVNYSPLAEGLASIGGYYNSPSSGVVNVYCQRNFALVVSPGVSSEDLSPAAGSLPSSFSDYDGDGLDVTGTLVIDGVTTYTIPKNLNGSYWLDDVAHYMVSNDMVSYRTGIQYVNTYTVGFMGSEASRRFLINTSNNGNDNTNLYDSTDPEYGKYHFDAASPEGLAQSLIDALNAILEKTNAFSAPVVPITRTTSGNRIYMSFFTPNSRSNFWQGNVVKLGLNTNLEITDKNGIAATYSNGAIKDTAEPYWATVDWANTSKANGILNTARNIYTYLGTTTTLTAAANEFKTTNAVLTAAVLGNPTNTTANIINYVRGADAFDADLDTNRTENRTLITGDVLHSEPMVYQYIHASGVLTVTLGSGTFQAGENIRGSSGGFATIQSLAGNSLTYSGLKASFTIGEQLTGLTSGATATVSAVPDVTMIYYGANDGMLHAVRDTDGTEAWGFIPPNQLARLKLMVESTSHQYYVDSSPKIYLYDVNGNGFIDLADGDKVILVSGERKGSTGYFALDVTSPEAPVFLWRINRTSDLAYAVPTVISQLGESWSEPRFGKIKTSAVDAIGTSVFVIGGGYSSTNATGKAVLVINVLTGQPVKIFENDTDGNANTGSNISGMNFSIPSTVRAMDTDRNGFLDKIYVGDMGSQVWRIGRFDKDALGNAIIFPNANENIQDWQGQRLFVASCNEGSCTDGIDNNGNGLIDEWRKFFYPPTVTLEEGYDLVFIGSGDRENPCHWYTLDEIYAIRDDHSLLPTTTPPPAAWTRSDLSDITVVSLDPAKKGWLRSLASGEKVLAESTVFAGILYFTTFTPNNDLCVPGGAASIYGLLYKTGAIEVNEVIGGGIPSRPVIVINDRSMALFVSVGSANPDDASPSTSAAILKADTPPLGFNLHTIWWKEGN